MRDWLILAGIVLAVLVLMVAAMIKRQRFDVSLPAGPVAYILVATAILYRIAWHTNAAHREWLLLPLWLILTAYYGWRVWQFWQDTQDAPQIRREWWKRVWDW